MSPVSPPVRLLPDVPFPPYTFVPGRNQHPTSDPTGHSFGIAAATPAPPIPDEWHTNRTYLYGLDLFNAGFYWECHVQFEALWLAVSRRGTVADFLKGLIKLAAAGVKHLEGRPQGVKSHSCRAVAVWHEVIVALPAERHLFFGLRMATLVDLAESVCRSGWPPAPPRLVPDPAP